MIRCIGCNAVILWDGKGLFSFTCPCKSTIFYNDELGQFVLPASLVMALLLGKDIPHLDYLIGESDYTSPAKEAITRVLKASGSIWMKDCEKCRQSGAYQRKLEREKHLALLEVERIIKDGYRSLD